jgi:hypothetical protein
MRRDPLWRAMWMVGLGLAAVVFTGLLLNLIPAGLTRLTWIISLAIVALVAALAAALCRSRRRPQAIPEQPTMHAEGRPWSTWKNLGLSRARAALRYAAGTRAVIGRAAGARVVIGYAAGAVAIAGTATGLAVVSARWQHSPGLAQLWLIPARGAARSQRAASGRATLGVRSQYRDAESFQLVLLRGTQPIGTWDFRLGAGQSWQRDVSAPAGQRLTARLTTVGQPSGTQSVAVTSS